MQHCFAVTFGDTPAGKVQVLRQGLYYWFHCRCVLSGAVICRLFVRCGEREESLGVVVPMGDGFGLDTRVPVRHLGEGEMTFWLAPKRDRVDAMRFAPIVPEEPFAYIERLKDAYLARKDGQIGALIPES